jgi:hypothetical protein
MDFLLAVILGLTRHVVVENQQAHYGTPSHRVNQYLPRGVRQLSADKQGANPKDPAGTGHVGPRMDPRSCQRPDPSD